MQNKEIKKLREDLQKNGNQKEGETQNLQEELEKIKAGKMINIIKRTNRKPR